MIYKNLMCICWIILILSLSVFAGEIEDGNKALRTGNSAKAFQIFMSAAEKGNIKAQTRIAYMYIYGSKDVPKDEKKGIEWFKKAADNGEPNAQFILAEMYRDGMGVKQDYSQTINYYQKAAEQGELRSTYNLGMMFETGTGVNKNSKISYALFIIASASGSSNAVRGSEKAAESLNNKELAEAKKLVKDPKKLWQLISIAKKEEFKRIQLKFGQKINIEQSARVVYGKLLIPLKEYIFIKSEPEGCLQKIKIYDTNNNTILLYQSFNLKAKIENLKKELRQGEYYIDFVSKTNDCVVDISQVTP